MSAARKTLGVLLLSAPPLAALLWIVGWTVSTPEPAEWLLLRGDQQLAFEWARLFNFGDRPAFFAQRILYLLVLGIPGIDFVTARFLPWLLTIACCVLFGAILRRTTDSKLGYFGLLLFVCVAFSPIYGGNWFLLARFRVLVPPLCFLASVLLLTKEDARARSFHAVTSLALLALFSEKSGVLLWPALVPLVLRHAHRRGVERPWVTVGWWAMIGGTASLLCFVGMREGSRHFGFLGHLVAEPVATIRYGLEVVGKPVPELIAHPVTPSLVALLLLGAFAWLTIRAVKRRGDPATVDRSALFSSLALFGLLMPVLAVEWHLGTAVADSWLRELLWPGVFLPVGVAGLCAVHAPRAAARAFPVLLVLAFVATGLDWHRGWKHLGIVHSVLRSSEARLVLFEAAGAKMDPSKFPPVTPKSAAYLRSRGLLSDLPRMDSVRIDQFQIERGGKADGDFLSATTASAAGVVHARNSSPPPSLVVITRRRGDETEEVVRITAPNYYGGIESLPWSCAWPTDDSIAIGDVVRSYAFHREGLRLIGLSGSYRRVADGFERVTEEGGG